MRFSVILTSLKHYLLRVPVMRSTATMAEPVNLDLPLKDIDVCVLLVILENAARKVRNGQCAIFLFSLRSKFEK